jgi:hypothetical protein
LRQDLDFSRPRAVQPVEGRRGPAISNAPWNELDPDLDIPAPSGWGGWRAVDAWTGVYQLP